MTGVVDTYSDKRFEGDFPNIDLLGAKMGSAKHK